MYKVRNATRGDLYNIVREGLEFAFFNETKHLLFDTASVTKLVLTLIENETLLICEKDGEFAGMFLWYMHEHMFNNNIKIANELVWWVVEKHRNSRVGMLLFKEYERQALLMGCHILTMSKLDVSPYKDSFLEKKGYKLKEKSFVLEV